MTEPTTPSSVAPAPSSAPAPSPSVAAPPGPPSPQPSSTPTRPDWAPESAWDAEKGLKLDDFGRHFAEKINPILTQHAAEQVRRNTLPQNADAYELKNSPAFKVPDGLEFKLDTDNPLWAQAKSWAHKNGLSQEAFAEAIDIVSGRDVFTTQQVKTARDAEIGKLGATGPARIDAIETFYKGLLDDASAKAMMGRVFTAADVQLHEKIISKFATQGHASFSQQHREPGGGQGRLSDEEYAKLTPGERFNYARQFDQSKLQKAS